MPNSTSVDHHLPPDMLMMLGRMDGKLDNVLQQLSSLTSKTDDHEQRLNALETAQGERRQQVKVFERMIGEVDELKSWRTSQEGAVRGASWVSKAILAVLTFALGAGGTALWNAAHPPKHVAKSEVVIAGTTTLPAVR